MTRLPKSFTIGIEMIHLSRRFIADVMLGKLARWLRILGYDTLYYRNIPDPTLVQIALSQQRWLLTRDAAMVEERRPPRYIFIRSDHPPEQLKQLVADLHLPLDRDSVLARCLECNENLTPLSKGEAKSFVPPYVHLTQTHFSQCPRCRRTYWSGTHYDRIQRRLDEIFSSPLHP